MNVTEFTLHNNCEKIYDYDLVAKAQHGKDNEYFKT